MVSKFSVLRVSVIVVHICLHGDTIISVNYEIITNFILPRYCFFVRICREFEMGGSLDRGMADAAQARGDH